MAAIEPTDEQKTIITHREGPALVLATAGSAKSTTILMWARSILAGTAVAPDAVLLTTFSRLGAADLRRRAVELGVTRLPDIRTLHSLAWKAIKQKHPRWKLPPGWWVKQVMKEVFDRLVDEASQAYVRDLDGNWDDDRMGVTGAVRFTLKAVMQQISKAKASLVLPDAWTDARGERYPSFAEWARETRVEEGMIPVAEACYRAYEAARRNPLASAKSKPKDFRPGDVACDHDDALLEVARAILTQADWVRGIEGSFHYVVVDECQDNNLAQWVLVRHVAKVCRRAPGSADTWQNVMVVGDDSQCAPPGSLVATTDGKQVPIEKLKNGDGVVSLDRHAKAIVGRVIGNRVEVARRRYKGLLVRVDVGSKSTRTTPNHRFLARWSDRKDRQTCVVYLMRKGSRFRVGWCQLFTGKGVLHLGRRANIERADALWILKAFRDRTDASVFESVIAAKYGLPTATFHPVHGARHLTAEAIESIFSALDGDEHMERAFRCLSDHGRDPGLPLWPPRGHRPDPKYGRMGRGTLFDVYAANLEPDLMSLPVPVALTERWVRYDRISSVDREEYDGHVYSLDVERYKTYIQDGIVTHNSIYTWRGARPDLLRDMMYREGPSLSFYPLTTNFRSGQAIIDAANMVLGSMRKRLFGGMLRCGRPDIEARITTLAAPDATVEATAVVDGIQESLREGRKPSEIAVLYRINAQSGLVEMELIRRGVPYRVAGRCFFMRPEIDAAIKYIALAINEKDEEAFETIYRLPFRFIGRGLLGEFPTLAALRTPPPGQVAARFKGAARLLRDMDGLIARMHREGLVAALEYVFDVIGVRSYCKKQSDEEDADDLADTHASQVDTAIAELLACARIAGDPVRFVEYVRDQREKVMIEDDDGEKIDERVTLSTVHRTKGLQYEEVFMIGVSAGLFPFRGAPLDEEKRLGYVAITRAKKDLHVSWTENPSSLVYDAGLLERPTDSSGTLDDIVKLEIV